MFGYHYQQNSMVNQQEICLWNEIDGIHEIEARLLPGFGANLCGLKAHGFDFLYPSPRCSDDTRHYGIPVLYPFPGIVNGCQTTFDGVKYRFPANRGNLFRHGYVMGEKFEFSTPEYSHDQVSVRTWIEITPQHPLYHIFPIANRLDLTFTLKPDRVIIDAVIRNLESVKRFPFGFGLHPYFNIIGPRKTVLIHVPMKKWLNPTTSELENPANAPADLRKPVSLDNLIIDDVWWGMDPARPQSLSYETIQKRVLVVTSDHFTHSVTYCPEGAEYYCPESWSCAPNAHNLHWNGKTETAHLMILNPGETAACSVAYCIENIGSAKLSE